MREVLGQGLSSAPKRRVVVGPVGEGDGLEEKGARERAFDECPASHGLEGGLDRPGAVAGLLGLERAHDRVDPEGDHAGAGGEFPLDRAELRDVRPHGGTLVGVLRLILRQAPAPAELEPDLLLVRDVDVQDEVHRRHGVEKGRRLDAPHEHPRPGHGREVRDAHDLLVGLVDRDDALIEVDVELGEGHTLAKKLTGERIGGAHRPRPKRIEGLVKLLDNLGFSEPPERETRLGHEAFEREGEIDEPFSILEIRGDDALGGIRGFSVRSLPQDLEGTHLGSGPGAGADQGEETLPGPSLEARRLGPDGDPFQRALPGARQVGEDGIGAFRRRLPAFEAPAGAPAAPENELARGVIRNVLEEVVEPGGEGPDVAVRLGFGLEELQAPRDTQLVGERLGVLGEKDHVPFRIHRVVGEELDVGRNVLSDEDARGVHRLPPRKGGWGRGSSAASIAGGGPAGRWGRSSRPNRVPAIRRRSAWSSVAWASPWQRGSRSIGS